MYKAPIHCEHPYFLWVIFVIFEEFIINDQVCARDDKNKVDACQGDSGGPMILGRRSPGGKCKQRSFLKTS